MEKASYGAIIATKEKCKITSDNSNLNCDLTFSNHVEKSLKIKSKLK